MEEPVRNWADDADVGLLFSYLYTLILIILLYFVLTLFFLVFNVRSLVLVFYPLFYGGNRPIDSIYKVNL